MRQLVQLKGVATTGASILLAAVAQPGIVGELAGCRRAVLGALGEALHHDLDEAGGRAENLTRIWLNPEVKAVIAGTGSNATAEAIDLTAHAKKAGATGALVVNPYYNRPTQEGLYRHFRAVAEAVDIPILVYNIASRTAVNVETDTMVRLAKDCPNIVGVKEASGSLDQMTQVILACGPDFTVLSGDDNITLPLMSVGGRGVISVIANIVPRETAEMTHAALAGDWKLARELHLKLFPLSRAMFIETNPIPVKEAMGMMGMLEPEFRLPMCPMGAANRERLRAILVQHGLIKG